MGEHFCDKALTIESHRSQLAELFEQGRTREGRLTEMETVLFGAERNGGGFIKETKETMEVMRLGQNTTHGLVSEILKDVKDLAEKRAEKNIFKEKVLPVLITAVFSTTGAIVVAVLMRGAGK